MPKLSLVAKPAGKGSITADAIPDQVKADIEELWAEFQKAPGMEPKVEFDVHPEGHEKAGEPSEDPDLWLRQAVSYGRQRMNAAGQSEALKIRALPKRNLPKHIKYFTIARDIPVDAAANTNKTSR
jgi:hypothetical protein